MKVKIREMDAANLMLTEEEHEGEMADILDVISTKLWDAIKGHSIEIDIVEDQ